jgi:hypothetical protein
MQSSKVVAQGLGNHGPRGTPTSQRRFHQEPSKYEYLLSMSGQARLFDGPLVHAGRVTVGEGLVLEDDVATTRLLEFGDTELLLYAADET